MSIKQVKRFTTLVKAGGATVAERRQILLNHSQELKRRRDLLDKCEEVLAIKISSYENVVGKKP